MSKKLLLFSVISLSSVSLFAQVAPTKTQKFVQDNDKSILEEYVQFLAIPNVSSDTMNIQKNTKFIMEMMEKRGIKASVLNGTTPGVTPAVYGEIIVPGAKKTLGFYAHYDGQPVNPKQWFEGLEP